MTETHPSLTFSKQTLEEQVVAAVVEPIDTRGVEERARRITESLNQLITQTEAELDSIEQRVLELVAKRLEKA